MRTRTRSRTHAHEYSYSSTRVQVALDGISYVCMAPASIYLLCKLPADQGWDSSAKIYLAVMIPMTIAYPLYNFLIDVSGCVAERTRRSLFNVSRTTSCLRPPSDVSPTPLQPPSNLPLTCFQPAFNLLLIPSAHTQCPMYMERYAEDEAAGKVYFDFLPGLYDAAVTRNPTHHLEDWQVGFPYLLPPYSPLFLSLVSPALRPASGRHVLDERLLQRGRLVGHAHDVRAAAQDHEGR